MSTELQNVQFYNDTYKRHNYFHYQKWLYEPYVCSLVRFCQLREGASLLDVGCGQGFFSYLFSRCGMNVQGIDISETGIEKARQLYGGTGISFNVCNVQTVTFPSLFDCIFVRSCSLYNSAVFATQTKVTEDLLRHLKPQGTLIFAYNSRFSHKRSSSWRYHSILDVRNHFSGYPDAQIFFANKATTYIFRKHSFNPLLTKINVLVSRVSGIGGDIVCVLRKPDAVHTKNPSNNTSSIN